MKKFLFLFLILVLISLSFAQNVINVGNDKEFTSIKDALEFASEGDKILVYEGIYKDNIEIYKSIDLEGVGNVTFMKEDEKKPSIKIKGEFDIKIMNIYFEAESTILKSTFANLSIDNCEFKTASIALSTNGGNIEIQNSIFKGLSNDFKERDTFNGNGIFCMYSDKVRVTNCFFESNGTGIYAYEIVNLFLEKNILKNNLTGIFLIGIDFGDVVENYFEMNTVGIEMASDSVIQMDYNNFSKSVKYDLVLSEYDCTVCENCDTIPFVGQLDAKGNVSDQKLFCPDYEILKTIFSEEGGS